MCMAEVGNFRRYISRMAQLSLLIVDDDEVLLVAIQDAIRFRLPDVAVSTSPLGRRSYSSSRASPLRCRVVGYSNAVDGWVSIAGPHTTCEADHAGLTDEWPSRWKTRCGRDAGGGICDSAQTTGPRDVNPSTTTGVPVRTPRQRRTIYESVTI